jgi:drug/metabolite transporter (DMT)-like permease
MYERNLKSDIILLLAAIIWGFAFVAQRIGMDFVGPFTYNGVRFTLGVIVLLPFLFTSASRQEPLLKVTHPADRRKIIIGSLMTGLFLFGGVALQQLGLQQTTAGKAGFITGLYVVFVPIAGMFFGHRSHFTVWAGAVLSLAGLYLLSVTGGFTLAPGDKLVLYCAIIFTFHVLFIAWLSPLINSYLLAVIQFSICALLNLLIASAIEPVNATSILQAWIPIIYGGVLSVGVAYTLQVIAQKTAHPAYASIILSLEAVFAVIGGWLFLHEQLTPRMMAGCGLMLAGMMVVQVRKW